MDSKQCGYGIYKTSEAVRCELARQMEPVRRVGRVIKVLTKGLPSNVWCALTIMSRG